MRLNLATLLFFTANGIAVVALPPYLRDLGLGEAAIGAVVSSAFFVSVVTRPLGGYLGDRVGYGRLMRLGACFATAAQALYLAGALPAVQAGRLAHGLAIASFLPASVASAAAEGPKAMASRSVAVAVGNILGPLLGSALYDLGGAFASFASSLALHASNVLLAGGRGTGGGAEGGGGVPLRVLAFTALLTAFSTVSMSLSTFVPVKLRDLSMPVTYWGIFNATAAALSIAPRVVMSRRPLHGHLTAAASTVVTALGLLMSAQATSLWDFVVAGAIYGLGQGFMVVSYQILALSGIKRAGMASAIYTMGWDLGAILGPMAAGGLISIYGYGVLEYMPLLLLANAAALLAMRAVRP